MRSLRQLATRNWRASRGRTLAIVVSIAIGITAVVLITSFHETAFRAIQGEVVNRWLGSAHISISPPGAHWGSMDASFAETMRGLDNVKKVTARVIRRLVCISPSETDQLLSSKGSFVDAIGIDPNTEYDFRTFNGLDGRLIAPGERGAVLLEREMADEWGVQIGDKVQLTVSRGTPGKELTIVGLFDSQRAAHFQQPMIFTAIEEVWEIKGEKNAASGVDVMLIDSSPAAIATMQAKVEALLHEKGLAYKVDSAKARQELLLEAERITRLILSFAAFVAMLTSFFIIVTTMSMSLFERRTSLGVLRCIGMTRSQLAWNLLLEIAPLGIIGLLVGLAAAKILIEVIPQLADDEMPPLALSTWGLQLAIISGLLTTFVSWFFLLFQVTRVTPLAAIYTLANPARLIWAPVLGVIGVAFIFAHEWLSRTSDPTQWLTPAFATLGIGTHYLGYVLIAPVLVVALGPFIVRFVARIMGLPGKLASDQLVRSPWRSTGVCWVMMVGLSIIVYIALRAESVLAIWDFPSQLPDAFVWTQEYVSGETIDKVRQLPGVGKCTITTDVDCEIIVGDRKTVKKPKSFLETFLSKLSRPVFVAGEAETLLSLLKISFVEGELEDCTRKMNSGGYVTVPVQTARNLDVHLGDRVTIKIDNRSAEFEIAGVIQSPAMDIAVTTFQATSYMDFAAAAAVLGTRKDLIDKFGIDAVSMFMFNFNFEHTEPPPDFAKKDLPSDQIDAGKPKNLMEWKMGAAQLATHEPGSMPHDFTNDRELARLALNWQPHLPTEKAEYAPVESKLREWIGSPESEPTPEELKPLLIRVGKALRHVSFNWDRREPQFNWNVFCERLVLLRVSEVMQRTDVVSGSLTRMREMVSRNLKRAVVTATWLPSIILLVASIGVANLMMVSVQMRSRQIAILRAVGMLKSQIVRLILAEAITLALIGSILGIALGAHEAYTVNRIVAGLLHVQLDFVVPVGTILLGVLVTVCVCLLAGIGPARYAARNNIVAAMQVS